MELENRDLTAEPVSLPLGFLRSITDDFCDERQLGKGTYGVVYKGILPCGSVIAVKTFNGRVPAVDDRSFENEASCLMDVKHHNVVQLLGFCAESRGAMMMKQPNRKVIVAEERTIMLCFEYVCNGSLDKHLSDESSGLEWNTRYKIIKGICFGLNFLHGCNIIHLDLKPENILMDATMTPKIADFGLSRLLGEQKSYTVAGTSNRPGTPGYMAPEYIDRGIISKKADIFSLGVIIIQILKGCKDDYPYYHQSTEIDFQHFTEKVFSNWRKRIFEGSSKHTSPELHTQQVKQCINIALGCVHPDKEKRPDVSNIIEILNATEESCYEQNGEDLSIVHQMGTQEGLPTSGVLREDGLVAPIKIALKDHAQAWITNEVMMTPVVAPLQPQRGPVLENVDGSLAALRYQGARNASFWVVHKTLASLEDNVLKNWAATINLDSGVEALEIELKYVKVFLQSTLGKVIHNVALEEILMVLRDLVYDADDVLDEMEYFRIHASLHGECCSHNHDTEYMPFFCDEQAKLNYRDNASKRMQHIVEKIQLMHKRISDMITPLGSNWSTIPNIAQSRPITTSESIEPKLYGRKLMMDGIIHDITKGKYSSEVLTVIPIVGPGGIGKTTLAQHIYHSGEVQEHFDVRVWTCVSLNFNVNKLIKEIQRCLKVDRESNGTASELIGQVLKNKRLLLVLDDIWDCSDEDEWKRLLVPFLKSQVQGNIIIVTTRFPAQAQIMVQKYNQSINLQGIEDEEFKELFLEIVFGHYDQSRKDHPSLLETGFKIVEKLKGSPLAAKTVGRLLKTQLDMVHWTRILESKEWDHSSGKNDIMVALKLSFDYLPSQLQQCFSYCALFPQDYEFKREELIHFWIGLEVLHSSHVENKIVEDIGQSHLTELVNYGFFEKKEGEHGTYYIEHGTYYIIHDLLYELAQKVSSLDCLSMDCSQSQVSSLKVLPSIRHLSINIDHTNVKDRFTLKNCVMDFSALGARLEVKKLRTLMIFGVHHGCFVKAFGDLFREAKALRLVFLSGEYYDVEDLLHNFYDLIHLRYLKIGSPIEFEVIFPNKISRFYHMMVLDVQGTGNIIDLPRDMSNLVKLRHFIVENDKTHSSIVNVGKLKSLQELRRFVVKRKEQGFDLREIGQLVGLRGLLRIYGLENVRVKEEADEAKLLQKSQIHELILHWNNIHQSTSDSTLQEHVLEKLRPSSNLQKLSIEGHWGTTCPLWLLTNLSVKSLESLCLEAVSWKKFPPIGELWLVNVPHEELSANIPEQRFGSLRRLQLCKLKMVEKWVVHAPCELFPFLEVLILKDCPELVELSFHHIACCQQGKEVTANLFRRLLELEITNCPNLLSFPPVPWSEAPCSIHIKGTGSPSLNKLVSGEEYDEYDLLIEAKEDTSDNKFWDVLAFCNLTGLQSLRFYSYNFLPLPSLQMLSSLRSLSISCINNAFPFIEADSHVRYQFPVEELFIDGSNVNGMELTQLLTYFPKLSYLNLKYLNEVTDLGVNVKGQRATETPGPSSSDINEVEQQQGARAADGIILASESEEAECSLLLLPPQLQGLCIEDCTELSLLCSNPYDDNDEYGRTGGGGLQALTSLRRLHISNCPKLLSAYSSSPFSSSFPFPNSLEHLTLVIYEAVDTGAPISLSNLTALISLHINDCGDLRGEGLLSLLAQGHLTNLYVRRTPNFFVDSKPSQVHAQELSLRSSKLHELVIDDVAGFTAASIHCSLLFSSLTKLEILKDNKVERFTDQQEALLFVNSLEDITFCDCPNLQSLPGRLHRLPKLKRLHVWECGEILMLPKNGFPSSLEELRIESCPKLQSLPKDCLPDSLQILQIKFCPAIRSLPEVDDLPSLLREIDVIRSESEELRAHCRKLINIIPIVGV